MVRHRTKGRAGLFAEDNGPIRVSKTMLATSKALDRVIHDAIEKSNMKRVKDSLVDNRISTWKPV